MKRKLAFLMTIVLIFSSMSQTFTVSKGAENKPSVTYNETVMSGMGLHHIIDGVYNTGEAYVSEDNPDMSDGKQYVQFQWDEEVEYNQVTLYSAYCGTKDKDGQAPTKWEILISSDGKNYTKTATVEVEWKDIDSVQSKTTKFILPEAYKYMRVVILEANLSWGHYAINEIAFGEQEKAEIGYVDENGTRQYGRAASVTYNDSEMSGNGLHNINDGSYTTTYVSEDSPNMSKQYIEYKWDEQISVNLITLYSQYCGAADRDGQAPTKWRILTSLDGSNFEEAAIVKHTWSSNDEIQSKNYLFENPKNVLAIRIEILEANLNWNHYAVGEIEVGLTNNNFKPTDTTGSNNNKPNKDNKDDVNKDDIADNARVIYTDKNGTKQYARASKITYSNAMSGLGLNNLIDGDYNSTYVSEDKPDMKNQYVQLTWDKPIEFDVVSLYAQYCGTKVRDGQAPTKWKIMTSTDGKNFTDITTIDHQWNDNDELQSKSIKILKQSNVVAVRIVILAANLNWNHYAINEIEIGLAPNGYIPSDRIGYENDNKKSSIYKDVNGVVQYASASEITYSKDMSGLGLSNLIDKNLKTTYVSEDKPNMKNQYIQFKWNSPVDINMVTLYTQYCGTFFKDGQAPTKWKILVSKDGEKFFNVGTVTKKWRSNDNVQSKTLQFKLQKDITVVRVVIEEAKLDWGHYAISEIEIGKAPSGYIFGDLTGVDADMMISPKTASDNRMYVVIAIMLLSMLATTYSFIAWNRKKWTEENSI